MQFRITACIVGTLLISPLLPLCMVAAGGAAKELKPPFFFGFENDAELNAAKWECHQLLELSDDHVSQGDSSLKIDMYPGSPYPGLKLVDFNVDWSNYHSLHFDVFNPHSDSIPLHIRIDDRDDDSEFADRFNTRISLAPGANHQVLHFDQLVTSGTERRLRLKSIEKVYLFLARPASKTTLYFDYLHLR